MVDTNQYIATVRRFWAAVSAQEIEAYLALFTETAVTHDPVTKPAQRTSAERRANMQGVFSSFSQIRADVDFVTICGDHSATKWTVVGTAIDGAEVVLEGIDVIRHAPDGRIQEMWGYF